jgi:hypothetical protein
MRLQPRDLNRPWKRVLRLSTGIGMVGTVGILLFASPFDENKYTVITPVSGAPRARAPAPAAHPARPQVQRFAHEKWRAIRGLPPDETRQWPKSPFEGGRFDSRPAPQQPQQQPQQQPPQQQQE